MKNLLFLLSLIAIFTACDSLTTPNTSPQKPKTSDPVITENMNNPVTKSLLDMRQREQELQAKIDEASDLHGDEQALFELDEQQQKMQTEHISQLQQILNKDGWVSSKKYGKTACEQALTTLKNADGELLESRLDMLLNAAKNGEANPAEVAFIHDKVLVYQGKEQRYGTQIGFNEKKGINDVYPIQDEANVNERRRKVGLEPIEDALKKMGIKY